MKSNEDSELLELLEQCQSRDLQKQDNALTKIKEILKGEEILVFLNLLNSDNYSDKEIIIKNTILFDLVGKALENLLLNADSYMRDEAVNALGQLLYYPALKKVQNLLCSDPDPVVRASAAETLCDLSEIEDTEVLDTLQQALNDSNKIVRAYSVYAMGYLGNLDCLPILDRHLMLEESLDVRAEIFGAKYALSGNPIELVKLLELLKIADEHLCIVILNTLKYLIESYPNLKIADNAPHIYQALASTSDSFPHVKHTVKKIIEKL